MSCPSQMSVTVSCSLTDSIVKIYFNALRMKRLIRMTLGADAYMYRLRLRGERGQSSRMVGCRVGHWEFKRVQIWEWVFRPGGCAGEAHAFAQSQACSSMRYVTAAISQCSTKTECPANFWEGFEAFEDIGFSSFRYLNGQTRQNWAFYQAGVINQASAWGSPMGAFGSQRVAFLQGVGAWIHTTRKYLVCLGHLYG